MIKMGCGDSNAVPKGCQPLKVPEKEEDYEDEILIVEGNGTEDSQVSSSRHMSIPHTLLNSSSLQSSMASVD